MKHGSTLFLRSVIILLGLIILTICIVGLPRVIGSIEPGGYDPILLGLYLPAVPFFVALYQAMRLLGYIDKNLAFSRPSVDAFRTIKICALLISGVFALGMPYVFYIANLDDAPGVVAIGLVIIFASTVVATFAAVMQRLVQNAVDIKKENDLTV